MFKKLGDILDKEKLKGDSGSTNYYSHRRTKKSEGNTFNFLSMVERWPEVVGDRLAEHTIPLKNVKNTLTILSGHPAYGEQLNFMEVQLIKKIETVFPSMKGSIKKINFYTNSAFFEEKKNSVPAHIEQKKVVPKLHKFSPQYKKLERDADEMLSEVEDLELKEMLKSIYIQGRQEN